MYTWTVGRETIYGFTARPYTRGPSEVRAITSSVPESSSSAASGAAFSPDRPFLIYTVN